MSINAKTVLVTGASRGLGLEFVKQISNLATPPEVLIAACRSPSTAVELQGLAKSNPSVKVVQMDTENDEDIELAVKQITGYVGDRGLNLLINNAGIFSRVTEGRITDVRRDDMQKHFDVNVSGPVILTQKCLPLLQKAAALNQGREMGASKAAVIMISALLGSQTLSHEGDMYGHYMHYKCSKTALNMATVLIARELKDQGIMAVAIHPGWVRTDMGTEDAPISPEESIRDCLQVIGNAGAENNGRLINFDGKILPY